MRRALVLLLVTAGCAAPAAPRPPVPAPTAAPVASATPIATPAPVAAPVALSCGDGERTDGDRCVPTSCPVGTALREGGCFAMAEVTCLPGMRFDPDDACVAEGTPPPFEGAYRAAMAELRAWRGPGPRIGLGPEARGKAFAALSSFHAKHLADPAARPYLVEVAFQTAYLLRTAEEKGADVWTRKTGEDYEALRASSKDPLAGTRPAELFARTALSIIDAEAWASFDYETGHLRYSDRAAAAEKEIAAARAVATKLAERLTPLARVETHGSARVAAEALARRANLFDGLRTSLQRLRVDGPDAAALRKLRDGPTDDAAIVSGYGQSVALALRFHVRTPALEKAWLRLAALDEELGEAKTRAALTGVSGLRYVPGMFKAPFPV